MTGVEWLIESFGCAESRLQDAEALAELFNEIVSSMKLHPITDPVWHRFPEKGGITGVWLLQESHLAVHTFPEYGSACLNVFCCTPRLPIAWADLLETRLGARETRVRECRRAYGASD